VLVGVDGDLIDDEGLRIARTLWDFLDSWVLRRKQPVAE